MDSIVVVELSCCSCGFVQPITNTFQLTRSSSSAQFILARQLDNY